MEQNADNANQNQSFFERNQVTTLVAIGIIIIGAIIFFSTRGDENQNQTEDEQTNETVSDILDDANGEQDEQNQNGSQENNTSGSVGNVSAKGTLRSSDNPLRGNLMVESASGNIYIATARDFSSLLDKPVTLQAEGSLNSFAFLGFAESPTAGSVAGSDTDNADSQNLSVIGKLEASDNADKGDYTITRGGTKIYLKTAHDYSSLIGSDVNLKASGTISSFSNAIVVRA